MVEGATGEPAGTSTGTVTGTAQAVRLVPFGAPALDVLVDTVSAAKRVDPLAPVTVIVPSALAGLTVRRRLAADSGVVALDTVVLAGLASRLAAKRLATSGRRPLTPVQRAALARTVLVHERARLTGAVDHPATVDALLRTFADMRPLDATALARLAASGSRAAAVVDLFRSYRRAAKDWVDDHDVVELAVEAVAAHDAVVDEIGAVVLYLPRRLDPAHLVLLGAIGQHHVLHTIVGTTGRHRTDESQRRLLEQLAAIGLATPSDHDGETPQVVASTIVRAADPGEEARVATRRVIERLGAGVAPDRIAVVSRVQSPYTLLVHEELMAAGVAHSAPAATQLCQSITGRVLLGLLQWPGDGHRRDDLMRLLRGAPVRDPAGGRSRPDRWDRVARDAGVVAGLDQWRQRLGVARERLTDRMVTRGGEPDGAALPLAIGDVSVAPNSDAPSDSGELQRRITEIDAMLAFVDRVADDTDPGERRSWTALSRWAVRLLRLYLGGETVAAGWSEAEQRSRAAILDLLDGLATLDDIEPMPGPQSFRRIVGHELSRAAGRVGTFGQGVFVGRLSEVAGADLDEVIVLGCAEGAFPPRAADDPLLPDRDRLAAGPALRRRGMTAAEEERDVLAVMAAADVCTLTFPIADPREQRTRQPAPFVLEQCSSLLGDRVDTDDVTRLRDDVRASSWFVDLPSFEWWLAAGGAPATPTELDVRELVRARVAREPIERLPVVHAAGLHRGLQAATARITGTFDEWSGWVGRWEHLADDLQHPRSATSLQQWATCPFRYFLAHVLDLEGLEDPGDAETITAADRGTLVHAVLERYFRSRIEGEQRSLDEIAGEMEAQFRAQGRTGRSLLWDAEWRALRRHLHQILAVGERDTVLDGVDAVAVEHRFGITDPDTGDAVEPVIVEIGNGRQMRFRGAVDRIDRSSDGRRLVVLDYKTGSAVGYAVLDPEHDEHDIVARGTLLQLPIYAAAAQAAYPGATDVEAYYWFIGQRGVIRMLGGPIDAPARDRFQAVMRTIADGIEGGVFPPRPGEEEWRPSVGQTHHNCVYCPYDRLCPAGRGEQWVALRERDELRNYVELAEAVTVAEGEAAEDGGEA
jgi:hypothetical protein